LVKTNKQEDNTQKEKDSYTTSMTSQEVSATVFAGVCSRGLCLSCICVSVCAEHYKMYFPMCITGLLLLFPVRVYVLVLCVGRLLNAEPCACVRVCACVSVCVVVHNEALLLYSGGEDT